MAAKKSAWTFARTQAGYRNLWSSIQIKDSDRAGAERFAGKITAGKDEYMAVERAIGVPWFFVGALHMRESSCNFAGVLHNGEHIIGKGVKTKLVPKGKGPFDTWHEAAIDALKLKGLDKITDWSAARMGFEAERFNGLGYVGKGVNSAYLWAGSNHEQAGKYVADHVWSSTANDSQIGVMTVMAVLCERDAAIARFMGGAAKTAAPVVETAPVPVTADRPGIWATLWRSLRGKDAAIATPIEKDRPGLLPGGDPALYDVQATLSDKGYTEVGQPDGKMGGRPEGRTETAIRLFRAANGLPRGDAIDDKFLAVLAAAGPRQVAKTRVETKASDLRENGNGQVATLDSLGWLGKALGLGGILGGINESGVLTKATDTLQTAQDTLGTVTTVFTTIIGIAQWCFAHWWMFAIGGGLYIVFKVASGVLHVVVMFRQGFLARADK